MQLSFMHSGTLPLKFSGYFILIAWQIIPISLKKPQARARLYIYLDCLIFQTPCTNRRYQRSHEYSDTNYR